MNSLRSLTTPAPPYTSMLPMAAVMACLGNRHHTTESVLIALLPPLGRRRRVTDALHVSNFYTVVVKSKYQYGLVCVCACMCVGVGKGWYGRRVAKTEVIAYSFISKLFWSAYIASGIVGSSKGYQCLFTSLGRWGSASLSSPPLSHLSHTCRRLLLLKVIFK